MLCPFCEGTEHSPGPHGLLHRYTEAVPDLDECATCGKTLWENCAACAGESRKLHVLGMCNRCGNSILYWMACSDCHGAGKHFQPEHICVPERAPKGTRIAPPAAARQQKSGGVQIGL